MVYCDKHARPYDCTAQHARLELTPGAVDSERFRRELKTHLFAGHEKHVHRLTESRYTNRHLLTCLLTYTFIWEERKGHNHIESKSRMH